jgi:hypothetical protein
MTSPDPFLPSGQGFPFTNSWPSQPAVVLRTPFGPVNIGNAAAGLCGGMVFAALDYWHAGMPPPPRQPAPGDPLYGYLVRRLIASWNVPAGVARYYQWMNLPDGDRGFGVLGWRVVTIRGLAWRTISEQWPRIAADLDRGIPAPLGLVTVASAKPTDLSLNHQAVAYGYQASGGEVMVQVYDPNSGPRDDVFIRFDPGNPAKPTAFEHNLAIGHPVRGFFRTAYAPATPAASEGLRR